MNKVKVTWITSADGVVREEFLPPPKEDEHFSDVVGYKKLTAFIEGPIEYVGLSENSMFYCHEEGKIDGKPENPLATSIFRAVHGPCDVIVGNVVMFETVD